MTWVRRDDQASIHRKVAPLDDATYRLWSEAIEWCSRNLTDGRIAADELTTTSLRATKPRAAILVRRGLWHEAGYLCRSEKCPPSGDDGWVIHDYFDYQPSREKVHAEQSAKAKRQQNWRDKQKANGGKPGGKPVDNQPQDALVDALRAPPRDASRDTSVAPAPSPSPPRRKAGDGTSPVAPATAVGGGASAAVEKEPNPYDLRPCPRCGNALASAYHRNVCAKEAA